MREHLSDLGHAYDLDAARRGVPLPDDWLDPPRFFSTFDDAELLALQTPGFDRVEALLLHEHAAYDMHPQVLTLAAR